MAVEYTPAGKAAMLAALGVTHVGAHTADPGTTGTNEVAGGTYARQPIALGAASGGVRSATSQPEIPIPAGVSVEFLGYWTAATGGELRAKDDIPTEAFGSAGLLRVASASFDLNNDPA